MKRWKYITLILGGVLLFFGDSIKPYGEYVKIVGLVILMFTIYRISSSLSSKNRDSNSDNLRL